MISNRTPESGFPPAYQVPEFNLNSTDQGQRGTCVAFSAVAMLDYLFRKQNKKFSPQYLYARCKAQDRNTDDGTGIENAFDCIRKYGVCLEHVCKYDINGSENFADEERLSALPVESCSELKFRMLLSPQNVDEYKNLLCGSADNIPMPVVMGCAVFTTGRKGNWLQEPAPGDNSGEGHAVLVNGWKDTPGLPSRGYFFAQNSLRSLTADSSAPLRIPYEYVEKYGLSAGTVFIEQSPEEISLNIAGKAETVSAADTACAADNSLKNKITAVEDNFFSTIRGNLYKAPYFYPDLHMPFFKSLQINRVKVEKVLATAKDYSADLKQWLKSENITDMENVSLTLYQFDITPGNSWYLICAFIPVARGQMVTADKISHLQRYISLSTCNPDIKHLFYTLGTNGTFSPDCNISVKPTVLLCEYRENDVWTHRIPVFERGQIGDEFIAHITPGRYRQKLEEIIRNWSRISDPQITVPLLRERMGFSPETLDLKSLELALDDIFAAGGYAKKSNGVIIPYKLWGELPFGARKCKRYTTSIKQLRIIQYVLFFITLLLSALAFLEHSARFAGFTFPQWVPNVFFMSSVIGVIIAIIRLKVKFKYNIN